MPKRRRTSENFPKNVETSNKTNDDYIELESVDDASSDEEDYEPNIDEIAAADAEIYNFSDGESIEDFPQAFLEQAAVDKTLYFTSKDGKITFETKPSGSVQERHPTTNPGYIFLMLCNCFFF